MSYITVGVGSNRIIERIVVAGGPVASVTFSTGIDGDVDRYFELLFRIKRGGAGFDELYMQPNSITTNQVSRRTTLGSSTASFTHSVIAAPSNAGFTFGRVLYDATNGRVRSFTSVGGLQSANTPTQAGSFSRVFTGVWNDTSTNITGFRLITDTGSSSIADDSEFILSKAMPN